MTLSLISVSCSKDDDKKCYSCTSELGNKFELCDNGNGTYDATAYGIKGTMTEEDLEGSTPQQVVDEACADDSEGDF
ncbi:hypothetical protein [Flagellimonas zhangzhouensis]|nr:hypothetical protein [Allomuricauda zhangzhouensis]